MGAPGETVDIKVGALDQTGNWQAAVWSLNEDIEYERNGMSTEEVCI